MNPTNNREAPALTAAKRAARSALRSRIRAIPPERWGSWGRQMTERLCGSALYASAGTVFCFVSLPTEPDTLPLLNALLAAGKRLCVPRILSAGEMEPVRITALSQLLPGAMGILEPAPACTETLSPQEVDLAVLPCLSANAEGKRLGKGGGFYDRFLARFGGVSVVLCPECLLLEGDALPTGELDAPADWLLTEAALLPCKKISRGEDFMNRYHIRAATPEDAEGLLALYAPYVRETAITFEYEVPTVEEFRRRIAHVLERYPYLVAEQDGRPLGYAYVSPFKERAAYDWAVESSIYIDRSLRRMGVGGQLHAVLEATLTQMGICNLEACIAVPLQPDEYLTRNSVEFHRHLGYRLVGEFVRCGYKFGRWYNMVWMEKLIGRHEAISGPPKRFCEIGFAPIEIP